MAVIWTSARSGERHSFEIHSINALWADVPGVYCMAALVAGSWHAKYIGQAASFRDRLAKHEQWAPAASLGATHVLAKVVHASAERDRVERMMIEECCPPLNVQYKLPAVALNRLRGLL